MTDRNSEAFKKVVEARLCNRFEKELMVNCSLNPSLTLKEIQEHHHNHPDLSRVVWQIARQLDGFGVEGMNLTIQEIKQDTRGYLRRLWPLLEQEKEKAAKEEAKKEIFQGEDMYEAVSRFNIVSFSHEFQAPAIPMSPYQAIGYLRAESEAGGHWNDYNPLKLAEAIEKIEELKIRSDFGINNPNTGRKITTYIRQNNFWVISFDVARSHDPEAQERFYEKFGNDIIKIISKCETDDRVWNSERFEVQLKLTWD